MSMWLCVLLYLVQNIDVTPRHVDFSCGGQVARLAGSRTSLEPASGRGDQLGLATVMHAKFCLWSHI